MSLGLVDGDSRPSSSSLVAPSITTAVLRLPAGAVDGYVLTSDAKGEAAWEAAVSEVGTITVSVVNTEFVSRLVKSGNMVRFDAFIRGAQPISANTFPIVIPAGFIPVVGPASQNICIATRAESGGVASFSMGSSSVGGLTSTTGLGSGGSFTSTVVFSGTWFV